jgi:hypothetical protein
MARLQESLKSECSGKDTCRNQQNVFYRLTDQDFQFVVGFCASETRQIFRIAVIGIPVPVYDSLYDAGPE